MAEIGISVVVKMAEYLVDPFIHRARRLFCFNNFVDDLQEAKIALETILQDMKGRAEEVTKNAEKLVQPVEKLLNDVDKVLEDEQKLEESVRASKSCLNAKVRYSLAKQAQSMTQQLNELTKKMNELNNCKISDPIELPRMKYFTSKDFVSFDSRKSAYDELMNAIQDDKSSIVGLVGMGGSGKTTLAKEVGKQAEGSKLFDKVIMAVVSQNPNVRFIQGQIADLLSFTLIEETEPGRARRLSKRLKTEKILIILDDVWKKLDLEAIGIPLDQNDNNCSILLTTRRQEVCTLMDCRTIIELSLLKENEGWTFFKQCAQIDNDSPDELRELAKRIAHKCHGLLIAMVTVGSTLKGKAFDEWKLALTRLENSQPVDVSNGLTSPYVCLKLSYDNLTNQVAKSLFLLCCMFPEDREIHMEDLFRFGRGVLQVPGLTDFYSMETTRMEFNVAVNTLLDCCLLMPTDEKECVRIHDMVRDVGLRIASSESQAILVARELIPRMLEEDEILNDTTVISLWDLKKSLLPEKLLCPKLKILLLHCPYHGYEMPNAFLERIKDTEVLALVAFSYTWDADKMYVLLGSTLSIPQSIESLTKLRTLCLRGYNLGDISVLGSMKGLEILDLRGSSFIELPKEIGALNKLKILDLYLCNIQMNNPYEVITRCSRLQELYITSSGDYSLRNASFPKLQRYDIWLSRANVFDFNDCQDMFIKNCGELRFLRIDLQGSYAWALRDLSIKNLFLRAKGLYLKQIREGYKDTILGMDKQHMNQLISLTLESCSMIKYLVDTTTLVNSSANSVDVDVIQTEPVFAELVVLWLHKLPDLEELFRDPFSSCSMQKLQVLRVEYCQRLYSLSFSRNSNLCSLKILILRSCPGLASTLFTLSIAQTLMALEELRIHDCNNLEYIIAEDEAEGSNPGPCSMAFGNLRILEVHNCDSLESLFPISLAPNLVRLKVLSLERDFMLKSMFGTGKDHWLSCYQNNNPNVLEILISLPSIRRVTFYMLPNLTAICPEHYRPTTIVGHVLWVVATTFSQLCNEVLPADLQAFLNLEYIDTGSLERWEGIFELQVEEAPNKAPALLKLSSNIERLECAYQRGLRFIWNGPTNLLSLHRLKVVRLEFCPRLKTIFSTTIITSLPKLEHLLVSHCHELEEIICLDSLSAPSEQVCFPKIERIEIKRCEKLKCIFSCSSHCPSLKYLIIESCSQLEQVVKFEHKAAGDEDIVEVDELFPILRELQLITLPNLIEIFPGYKSQPNHKMQDCPKYASSSTSTSVAS